MYIEKRINLNNNYYIRVEIEYKKDINNHNYIIIKDWNQDDYYDDGNFSLLIKHIEKEYQNNKPELYKEIPYMNDILYLYSKIPFLKGIEEIYTSNDNIINTISYISREDIDKFIIDNNIVINKTNIKLSNEQTWN